MKKLIHFFKLAWKVSPLYILLLIGRSIADAAKIILNVILPMLLINELLGSREWNRLVVSGGLLVLNNAGMTLLANTLNRFIEVKRTATSEGMLRLMSEKIMNLEYAYLEDPHYLDLKEQAVFSIQNQNAIDNLISLSTEALGAAFTLIGLAAVLATLGPVLFIVLVIGIAVMLLLYKSIASYQTQVTKEIVPINRRFGYYMNLGTEKETQKDIRLYDMEKMITGRILGYTNEVCDMLEKIQLRGGWATGGMSAVSEGISAFSYAYVGIRTISELFGPGISIGELTMYVSAAITFSQTITRFGYNVVGLLQFLAWLDPYMEFMLLPEQPGQTGRVMFQEPVETVEFCNVTFTYPKAEKPVLSDISFSIHKGEKISIVGLNGAGKSTLVKLLCRMYQADSGEILVNGKNINEYDYLSYMQAISAVFQDYRLLNFSIAENISCRDQGADLKRVEELIGEVGLSEKVAELPNGIESRFGKDYDEDGIEMSGGQSQKIAIARALYKKASMVILDEPASALDPIAEAEIYEKFNSLVEEKTAIYISHRMSSSVFCDKILVMEGGRVADYDTHENLMKKSDSLYYKLFRSQAENYKLA